MLPQTLSGFFPQWRQALDHTVSLGDIENPLSALRIVAQVRRGFPQRQSFSELDHTSIVPHRRRLGQSKSTHPPAFAADPRGIETPLSCGVPFD